MEGFLEEVVGLEAAGIMESFLEEGGGSRPLEISDCYLGHICVSSSQTRAWYTVGTQ